MGATAILPKAMRLLARAGVPGGAARLALASLVAMATADLRVGTLAPVITGPWRSSSGSART